MRPRMFPLQGYETQLVRKTGSLNEYDKSIEFQTMRMLGPRPPQIILRLPSQQMMTLVISCCAIKTRLTMPRRQAHYFIKPGIIEPSLRMPDRRLYVQVDMQAVATRIAAKLRQPHSKLLVPQVLAQPPPPVVTAISVTLAGRTRAEARRRAPHSLRIAPAVYNIPIFSTTVWLAARYRRGHWDLPPPTYISNVTMPQFVPVPIPPTPPFAPILVSTVAPRATRETYWRRYVEHAYFGPLVVSPAIAIQTTIDVSLALRTRADARRRAAHYRLAPPAVVAAAAVAVFSGPRVSLTAAQTRATYKRRVWIRSRQGRPVVVFAPGPPLNPPTVRVELADSFRASRGRRATHYSLYPPVVTAAPSQAFYGPAVTLASSRARLLSRRTVARLAPPAVIAAPSTQQQQTLSVTTVAVSTRRDLPRRCRGNSRQGRPVVVFAPGPPLVTETQVWLSGRTRAETQRRAARYFLKPPATLTAGPTSLTLRQQTISVTLATQILIASLRRRQPLSGLGPPFVVNPIASLRAQVINVTLVAIGRTDRVRREPTSRLSPPAVQTYPPLDTTIAISLAGRTRSEAGRRAPHSHLSPPAVVEPYIRPPDRRLTILVVLAGRTRTELTRRAPHSRLMPPAVVGATAIPTQQQQTISVHSVAVSTRRDLPRRCRGNSRQGRPIVVFAPGPPLNPPTVEVALAGANRLSRSRRAPHYALSPPATVAAPSQVFYGPAVTLAASRARMLARHAISRLTQPATLEPWSIALQERQIDVWSAGRTRIETVRRAPHSHLQPPQPPQAQTFPGPSVTLAVLKRLARRPSYSRLRPGIVERSLLPSDPRLVIRVDTQAIWTRTGMVRRLPHSHLPGPAIGAVAPPVPVATTLLVAIAGRTRVEAQRRATHYRLAPPAVVEAALQSPDRRLTIQVDTQAIPTRQSLPRRAPHYELAPPATLEPAAVAQRNRTIDTLLVAVPDRMARLRRGPHSRLSPPATLEPEFVELREQTITVILAGRTRVELVRRAPHYRLAPPAVVGRSLQPPDRQLTIPAPFAPAPKQPRRTHWFYRGPASTPPLVTTVRVAFAYRTRTETQRRAPHFTLGEPTTLRVFAGPRVTLTSIRTRVEAVRRGTHYRLAPPTKINPLATLAQQTLHVADVAVRTRVEHGRHIVQHFLQPPTVILPHADIERQTIKTRFKIAVWNRVDRVRRLPHYILFPPTVIRPIALVTWRLSPDTNWILEAAAVNDWLADPAAGWEMEASPNWRIEADPEAGWIIGNR